MSIKTMLTLMVAGTLLVAGCSKKEDSPAGDTPAPPPVAPASTDNAATGEVAKYDDMVPQGGTKRTLQNFTVFQAADPASTVLTRLAPGTFINLKGSHGNWMLVEWPSGVGQLSPGWIELRANDSRVTDSAPPPAVVDAGVPVVDAGVPVVDAGTPAPVDAGSPATDAGTGRGTIRIIPKKK